MKWVIYLFFFDDVFSFDFLFIINNFFGVKMNFIKMGRSRIGDFNIFFYGEFLYYNLLYGIELVCGFFL